MGTNRSIPLLSILLFYIFALSGVAHAGSTIYWGTNFENEDLSDWNLPAGTTAEDFLTHEYNRSKAENSSTSLSLASDKPHSTLSHDIQAMDSVGNQIPAKAGVVSAYFYDNGADLASFRVGIETSYSPQPLEFLGIGVEDSTVGSADQYLVLHDGITSPSGIVRSAGWHRVQVGWNPETSPTMSLDRVLVSDDSFSIVPSAIDFNVTATTATSSLDSSETATQVRVDDVLFDNNVVPWSFSENFEGNLDPYTWTFQDSSSVTGTEDPNICLDSTRNHTPGSGADSSILVYFDPTNQPSSHGPLTRDIATPESPGYITTWFYDEGASVTSFSIYVTGAAPDEVIPDGTSDELGITVTDSGTSTTYVVYSLSLQDSQYTSATTGIPRSVGWHKLMIGTYDGGPGLQIRLDDIPFPGNTFPNLGTIEYFTAIEASRFQTEESTSDDRLWVDDLSYTYNANMPALPPAGVKDWMEFEP